MAAGRKKRKVLICKIFTDYFDSGYKLSLPTHTLGVHYLQAYCLANPLIRESFDIAVKDIPEQNGDKIKR